LLKVIQDNESKLISWTYVWSVVYFVQIFCYIETLI
jgi:hypothetical protein